VAQTINGVTTYFVGGYYEKTGSTETKYYSAGSQRVAMRRGDDLYYLLGDHLGSTSLTTDASGDVVSELRYTAWGEVRYESGMTPTEFQYTGQYSNVSDFGLMYYNARWYDGQVGRFTSADTLIPGAGDSQAWDRYAYAKNAPSRHTDPSGHRVCDYDCQIRYENADPEYEHYCEMCDWNVAEQRENAKTAETILYGGTELVASVLFEPADWAYMAYHCASGDCSPWMLAGLLPILPSNLAKHLADVPWKSVVKSKYWEIVEGAFKGEPGVVELADDLHMFRRYGGTSMPTGSPWFSLKPYAYPGNARRYLALPNTNLATNVAEFIIPRGATILIGKTAEKTMDTVRFGSYALGGGFQIYVPDPTIARLFK